MNKLLKISLVAGLLISLSVAGRSQEEKTPVQMVSFETLNTAILKFFPEAYEDFLTISFMRRDEFIIPETATFMIPELYFRKKALTQKTLEKQAQLMMEELDLSPACQVISMGEVKEYAWEEWKDKTVRKVILQFGIGC